MKYQATLRRLKARLPKNNQKGFTLIELLVVISILGILAAIVTMSLVGITAVAQNRAAATEANTVQIAYDTMLADMRVLSDDSCKNTPAAPTNDMTAFPSNLAWTADPTAANFGKPVSLYPHYLRENKTHGQYSCVKAGEIVQALGSYVP